MLPQFYATLLAIVIALLVKVVHLVLKEKRLKRIMPPGPLGLPLLGNALQFSKHPWVRLTEWKERYGSIYSLNIVGQPVIVVNDFRTAADLLDKRSSVYSDRPPYIMAREILTNNLFIPFLGYSDLWRRMRRGVHEALHDRACDEYQPHLEKRTGVLISQICKDPDNWEVLYRRFIAAATLETIYGWQTTDTTADVVAEQLKLFTETVTRAVVPGTFWVEFFPSMLHLPASLAKWKREGLQWFRRVDSMLHDYLDHGEVEMEDARPQNVCAILLKEQEKLGLSRQEVAWLAGTCLGGAVSTSLATLNVFMLAMALFPNVQKQAQAQIDDIVGRQRFPRFSDRKSLPYITAMIKETLRWKAVTPISIPTRSIKDDWYRDYYIPRGSIILCNIWAMNQDPKHFPDYDDYRPERYLDVNGHLTDNVPDTHHLGHMSFGSGRRICPGKDLADRTLFIVFATILWAFKIECPVDKEGHTNRPSFTDLIDEGSVIYPPPVKYRITPRFSETVDLVESLLRTIEQGGLGGA